MRTVKTLMSIKKEQLELERSQTELLYNIHKRLLEIRKMLEVKAVVRQRGGQIWKN